jgi:hypothetical protein
MKVYFGLYITGNRKHFRKKSLPFVQMGILFIFIWSQVLSNQIETLHFILPTGT